jgi:hypothetical protein
MHVVNVRVKAHLPILSVVDPTDLFIRVPVTAPRAQIRCFRPANQAAALLFASDHFTITILTLFACWGDVQIESRAWWVRRSTGDVARHPTVRWYQDDGYQKTNQGNGEQHQPDHTCCRSIPPPIGRKSHLGSPWPTG